MGGGGGGTRNNADMPQHTRTSGNMAQTPVSTTRIEVDFHAEGTRVDEIEGVWGLAVSGVKEQP